MWNLVYHIGISHKMLKHLTSLLFLALANSSQDHKVTPQSIDQPLSFEEYTLRYGKIYTDHSEYQRRKAIFQDNIREMVAHNAKHDSGQVLHRRGLNQFSDMSSEEFQQTKQGLPSMNSQTTDPEAELFMEKLRQKYSKSSFVFPTNFSWVDHGIVSKAKDQGDCGSCSAFAATSLIESCFAQTKGQILDLSEQYLVDCAYNGTPGLDGCVGAFAQDYLQFAATQNEGYDQLESFYPYKDRLKKCTSRQKGFYRGASVKGELTLWDSNEEDLMLLLYARGPVVTSLNLAVLQNYHSGIARDESGDCCNAKDSWDRKACTSHNSHAVAVVGYGSTLAGDKYWIVKNSWGSGWGENGFFKILRGVGHCGFGYRHNDIVFC